MNNYRLNKKRTGLFSRFSLTTKLIIINVVVFILVSILSAIYGETRVFSYLALTPGYIMSGKYLWTLFTHMFLHANIVHLFFNMFSLWFIGKNLEKIIGSKRFLRFYIFSGIFAGVFFVLLSGFFGYGFIGERLFGNPALSGVGASGAIFGLLGVMALIVPKTRIYLIAGPLIAIVVQSILEASVTNTGIITIFSLIINIYILVSVFSIMFYNPNLMKIAVPIEMRLWALPIFAIVPLVVIGLFFPLPIANTAHIGGFLAGAAFGYYLRVKYKNKIKILAGMFK